jgi:hypothetical protein
VALEYRTGFVRVTETGALAVSAQTAGATFATGFLRAPTGELIVVAQ